MEPRNYTITDVFDGNLIYVVPRYQRLYVWNEEDQWAPLWEDVIDIAKNLCSHVAKEDSNANEQGESHFFGTLVLKLSGYTPDEAKKWRVIDGQQRLTTLQLMMSAVADELNERGLTIQAGPIVRLTSNSLQSNPFSADNLKITHGSEHYNGFIEAMNPTIDKKDINGSMGDCYRFFRESVSEWFLNQAYSAEDLADNLRIAILRNLRVVAIFLDPHEEEHKIFETLNARGAPLTEWDKIKNFMLFKADAQSDVDQNTFFDQYLDTFDQMWWRKEVGRGAQKRPRTDVFADYWLESKTIEMVGARRVFREFQNFVNARSDCLVNLGEELISDAKYFEKFEQRILPAPTVERRFHNRRLWVDLGAWWPLIFELNRRFEKSGCPDEVRAESINHLESFLVRRLVVGYQARSYDRIGLEILRSISNENHNPDYLANIISDRLMVYDQANNQWPQNAVVRNAVRTRKIPSYVQRLVLEAIEESLISQDAGYQMVPDGLEVEHLMPSGWREEEWPILKGEDYDETAARRDEMIRTFGNLTLIRGGLNKRLSNRSWPYKRKLIEQSDNLFINKKLLIESTDRWDEDDIVQRGEWMAAVICQIWPHPGTKTTVGNAPPITPQAPGFVFQGQYHATKSSREIAKAVLTRFAENEPEFLRQFAQRTKGEFRTRRFIARSQNELYPDRPDLAAYSVELVDGWWMGTNYSTERFEKMTRLACEVANIEFGKDLAISWPKQTADR